MAETESVPSTSPATASSLTGKHVVLGVTGGIAAYKAVEVVSRLRKKGAHVHVIMTRGAQNFVTELTFREMSGEPVITDMWAKVTHYHVEHIALAQLADVILVAPATANVLAKAACGMADDMLTTTLLATKAPIFVAPAMNTAMYENPVTQENIERLRTRGVHIIAPASGPLACGTRGAGRLPEPVELVDVLERFFDGANPTSHDAAETVAADANETDATQKRDLVGRKILVTAGGTHEPLDPVRFLGNRSTGKMGFAVAEAAAARGADVMLVAGPVHLATPAGVRRVDVLTAQEMHDAVLAEYETADAVIKAAAVADYRPKERAGQKIKKKDGSLVLELVRNPDILKELGERKTHQILVGFAAETERVLEYAAGKLKKKNLDFIVANDVSRTDAGFSADTNRVTILGADGTQTQPPLMSKRALADVILDGVAGALAAQAHGSL
ncbi:MAG: bifunctional phosphopantothenoylcysteine decarboxylase/phosphopantothenate--cysteine ligase CoaBC [Selenomonas sp.]|uniref:bifunctional phosphopantothenoylcysteine decarboxylase/phosphopantothenate--cysteine ligase CoaBC n=1 Tax=Selenomonas sp. TaxID=2053611 RepID=UPI0025F23525|nr:bifunctional phosphopantothenoylcysteine decarboxylase/phosphopantothenate--cysteine ligase CoaBC [Selenomonas sp.]MCI6086068.1 bifunctional phosphopantothenoylcysteine decarboxylase/phosphopantothenate--cysteine ligase CoaBC [Selenomonas sp.]MDY4416014.1 bifunctional phosphopantothenoylcysteine decarboxylase/phosphopantothenate--cysteine ligase CoaBC [Selenomonas sp.]